MECRIQMLDGTDLVINIDKKALGHELLEAVCKKIGLNETDYFGCTYKDAKTPKIWIQNNKKLSRQINNSPWLFAFEVKFYPPDPTHLNEEITRYQMFLQLRVDILSGRLPCSFMTYALLGSYAAQSQFGDHVPSDHGNGSAYLKDIAFAPNQSEELLEKIAELHKTHLGMQPAEAEVNFLENAGKLSLYGVHLFLAKEMDDSDIEVGICAAGILIFKARLRIHRFTWPKILKISYKRNIFTIKIRPGEFEQMETALDYKLANYHLSKRLWKLAVEHHAFFRLRETDPMPNGLFSRFGPKYRFTGRTFYQAQNVGDKNQRAVISRVVGRKFGGSKSMETVLTGYSTERSEVYQQQDSSRTATLDLNRRRQGSLNDLDVENNFQTTITSGQYGQPPQIEYYNNKEVWSDWGSTGRLLKEKDNNASCSATSDEATFPTEPHFSMSRYHGDSYSQTRRDVYNENGAGNPGMGNQFDMLYEQNYQGGRRGDWDPFNPDSSDIASSKSYTTPDGTRVTEHRRKDGVIETRSEKRHPDGGCTQSVDYDKALSDAILAVTNMNTNLAVEKIEIQTREDSTFI